MGLNNHSFEFVWGNTDFRQFADKLSVIIFAFYEDKYVYVNPAFEQALGYSSEEMLQKNVWDICHPDYQELVCYRARARLRGEEVPSNYEIRAIRKDGSDLWVDVFFNITRIGGKTISIVGAYDITERKRLQEALAQSEAKYRAVVEEQRELIIRYLPEGQITFMNNAFCRQFNIDSDTMLGTQIASRLFGQQPGVLTEVRESLKSGQPFCVLEQEIKPANGESTWLEWVFSGLKNENGDIFEYQAVGRDITERKKTQQMLQEARDRLELSVQERTEELNRKNMELTLLNHNLNMVIMNMSDGVFIIHRSGSFEWLNPGLKKTWGNIYRDLEEHFRAWVSDENNQYMQRLFVKGESFQDEEISVPSQGVTLRFLASGTPTLAEQGVIDSAVLILRPIKNVHHLVNRFSGSTARFRFEDIVTCNPQMKETIEVARMAARSSSNVLIEGESGTGKELFAQAIHNASKRSAGPFVAVNCGAIPRELIASELFGYSEGAFTGAKKGGNPGKFELADGGTLFLDEIGDMPLEQQVALLRVIQEKSVSRIGSNQVIPVDVRIICATNKNLLELMQTGRFRQDLYYRLNVINLRILPLRERKEDIPVLFQHFLQQMNQEGNQLSQQDVIEHLLSYDWPGNVRELQNVVERFVHLEHMPDRSWHHHIGQTLLPTRQNDDGNLSIQQAHARYKNEQLEKQRQQIVRLLEVHQGNVSKVAKEMGISRSTLYRKMKSLSFD
ncbi:MAG TPA: sigma 54-interacting transcriptional regulator [Syntrophomonadaceae bacterium]|nr:sigma 54-interacting transcriptional regulator [Syntrophomonadaceae bacterium]HPU48481.1 sigma 54-interacting transcriptional regulator [Syntrophomonadaceae bacterium]